LQVNFRGGFLNLKLPAIAGTLEVYMAEINKFPILSAEEEFRYAIDWQKNMNMEAAEKLVVSNLRFVVKIAHEYRNYGVKLADLIQEGNIGLMPVSSPHLTLPTICSV